MVIVFLGYELNEIVIGLQINNLTLPIQFLEVKDLLHQQFAGNVSSKDLDDWSGLF